LSGVKVMGDFSMRDFAMLLLLNAVFYFCVIVA